MRTPAAADNTPPVFDQKYGGMVELNTKRGQMAFSSIDVARWRIVPVRFRAERINCSVPAAVYPSVLSLMALG